MRRNEKANYKSELLFKGSLLAVCIALLVTLAMVMVPSAFADTDGANGADGVQQPPVSQSVEIRVEGDADNPADQIFVSKTAGGYTSLSNSVGSFSAVRDEGESKVYTFNSEINELYVYIKTNSNTMYYGSLSTDENNPSKIGYGQTRIQLDKKRCTVTWAYDAIRYGEDAYLQNGTAQIIAVNNQPVNPDNWDIFGNNPGNADGGNLVVTPGSTVTVQLKPNYGYQLKSVSLNGNTLIPQEKVSTFTFVMPNTNVHFSGAFALSSDTVANNASNAQVTSLVGGNGVIDSGNIALSVTDSAADTSAAKAVVNGAVSAQAVELSLASVVNKGNGEAWIEDLTNLDNPVTISMTIADYDSAYDYAVVRDHDGELTRIDSKINDGALSFSTDKFSTYTIVKAEKAATGTEAANPDKQMLAKTGDSNVAVFAVFLTSVAAFSLLVAYRRARL